jgi:hypothetical protein
MAIREWNLANRDGIGRVCPATLAEDAPYFFRACQTATAAFAARAAAAPFAPVTWLTAPTQIGPEL